MSDCMNANADGKVFEEEHDEHADVSSRGGLMGAYLTRRLVFSVFILWGAVSIIFVVLRLIPSDPARLILGSAVTGTAGEGPAGRWRCCASRWA